jgi:HD superfamily phosphodiesterase
MSLFSKLFIYVLATTSKYKIDDSHGISHSMNVLYYANQIFQSEVVTNPYLKNQERIIYVSSVLHDMCDKKYMTEADGIQEISEYLEDVISPNEIEITKNIISTMSYSKVKKQGFPDLGNFQDAYHIVREADLLTAYDFDRSMIYHMYKSPTRNIDATNAFMNANDIFEKRILKHNEDGLFITNYSKMESQKLHNHAVVRMQTWKKILRV